MMRLTSTNGDARMKWLIRAPWLSRRVIAAGGALTLCHFENEKARG